jgi:excisionase family DNA binding protein
VSLEDPPAELTFAVSASALAEAVARHVVSLLEERVSAPPLLDRWIGVEQAAEYIDAPPSRIYDLVAQRRIRFVKDGRRVLTRRSWLDEYLEGVSAP